ncbi:MAG: ATP-binding protein [Rhodopila sp.]
MTYLIAASAASILFIAASRRGRQPASAASPVLPPDPRWAAGPHVAAADPAASGFAAQGDVAGAASIALARLGPMIASQSIRVDVAIRPGLRVRMRGHALTDMLEELLAIALRAAPASQLLLTAVPRGDQVDISVTDDMPVADAALRQGQMRSLAEQVAARGEALTVSVRSGEGTTMTLRLAGCSADTEPPAAAAHGGPR